MSAIDRVLSRLGKLDNEASGPTYEALFPFVAAGPVSLLATLSLALFHSANLDLVIATAVGIFLSFSLALRGLAYSLLVLFLGALCKHWFFLDQHLWQLGVECSVAIGFALCAFAAELLRSREEALGAALESQNRVLSHLEEEVSQCRQEALEEKILLQNRLMELQKEADEVTSELSSLKILNDVLRKSALKTESTEEELAQKEQRIAELLNEIELYSKAMPVDAASFQEENARLQQELNMARLEREQTYLINETLVRLHSSSDRKIKEQAALQERLSLQNDLLQKRISEIEEECGSGIEKVESELQQARLKIAELVEQRSIIVETERRQWTERLSERDRTLMLFQERVRDLSETQALYFQLKKQFEEKNEILHQTRKELFRTETALQAAQMEQRWEEVEFPLFELMLTSEVALLEDEKLSLETENAELSAIIGLLSKPSGEKKHPSPKKRKISKKRRDG